MSKELLPEAVKAMRPDYSCQVDDETLRDGLQDPDVRQPTSEEALVLFDLMHQLGTHKADIGFANAGAIHQENIRAIAAYNASLKHPIEISCAARMRIEDIEPIVVISQQTGAHLWADTFIGSDPNRIKIEGWTSETMVNWIEEVVSYALSNGIDVMMVTENTIAGIQKDPNSVEKLYLAALNKGAKRVCISDTTGNAYHKEVETSVLWMRQLLDKNGFGNVGIDFHGHNDLASAVPNSIAAIEAGAQRVHATILGVGERCGNTDRTTLQLQLRRIGLDQGAYNLKVLPEYALEASRILGIPIPSTYPGIGEKSRSVVAGVHANAVFKACQKLPKDESGGVYLPVNYQKVLGLEPPHISRIGPMAGLSNVYLWASLRSIDLTESQAKQVLSSAKSAGRVLSEEEILKLLD